MSESLGQVRPEEAMQITILVGGQTLRCGPEAYQLSPQIGGDGMVEYSPQPSAWVPEMCTHWFTT